MRAPAVTLAGLLALALPAAAQQACPGHVSATAITPVPGDARIAIALRDDNPTQVRLRDAVYARLQRAGHPTGAPAAYTMSWRGSQASAGGTGTARSDLMFSDRNRFQDSDDLSWMQAVPRNRRPAAPGPLRLSGSVELREVATGRVAWTAVFSCDRQGGDDAALVDALAAAIVPILGRTVAGQRF